MTDKALLDVEVLERVRSVVDERFSELIEKFYKNCDVYRGAMQDAIEANDMSKVRFTAHSFKTSAAMLGLFDMRDAAKVCEDYAAGLIDCGEGIDEAGYAHVKKLYAEAERACEALKAYLEG